jgi:hypothetical protein
MKFVPENEQDAANFDPECDNRVSEPRIFYFNKKLLPIKEALVEGMRDPVNGALPESFSHILPSPGEDLTHTRTFIEETTPKQLD